MAKRVQDMKRFGDVRPRFGEGTEYVKVEELEGKEFILKSFKLMTTQWGEAAVFTFEIDGEDKESLTFSSVLVAELKDIAVELPVIAMVKKTGRYWTFV